MFKDGSGMMGTVINNKGTFVGQARLNPVAINPVSLFTGIALMTIDLKLDKIAKAQKDIQDFLEIKEEANIEGSLIFLSELINNFKYNWSNENFKQASYVKVLDIKQESYKQMVLRDKQLQNKLIDKKPLISLLFSKRVDEIKELLQYYRLSIFMYSFSSFAEILLMNQYNNEYVNNLINRLNNLSLNYKELYTAFFNNLEASCNNAPLVKKDLVNELITCKECNLQPFVETMTQFSKMYEDGCKITFDEKCIYLNAA